MRWTRNLPVILIVLLIAACGGGGNGDGDDGGNGGSSQEADGGDDGGDGGGGESQAAASQDDGGGDDGGDGGSTGSVDLDEAFATLTPPNATELSKTTTAGVIFAAWDSPDDIDSLQSFYEGAIADAGLQIIQTTTAQDGIAWVVAENEGSSFGGTVSIFPASDGSGTQISVTIGDGN